MHRQSSKLGIPYIRHVLLALALVVLTLQLLQFPIGSYNTVHDSSSCATFEYYAAKKIQFGTEMYQNIGPLGYIHYSFEYIGYLHWQKVILSISCRILLVLLIVWMLSCIKTKTIKVCWYSIFFIILAFANPTSSDYSDWQDNLAYLTLYLLSLWLFQAYKNRLYWFLGFAGWSAVTFISLQKNTFFVIGCSILIAVFFQHLVQRNKVQAFSGVIAFLVSLAIHWVLAGQHIENLPQFVHGVFAFSDGYNEAMALPTPTAPLILGIVTIALFSTHIIAYWRNNKNEFGRSAVEAFLLFIMWKHGFVRSDEHMLIFFFGTLMLVIPVFFYVPTVITKEPKSFSWVSASGPPIIILISLLSFYLIIPNCHFRPSRILDHIKQNIFWIISPLETTRRLENHLHKTKMENSLVEVKKIVGNATIDFFGYEPGYLLLNDLNYTPRPMPITFAAMNYYLQKANESFYRDPLKAPQFVLYQYGGVDNRLFAQDDALALQALFDNYLPILVEKNLLLLKKRDKADIVKTKRAQVLGTETINFDQELRFFDLNSQIALLEVTIEHTVAGKLLAFIFKPPPCYIGFTIKGDQQIYIRKFVTSMGKCSFMMNPFINNVEDVAKVYDRQRYAAELSQIHSIMFFHDKWRNLFFKKNIVVRCLAIQLRQ